MSVTRSCGKSRARRATSSGRSGGTRLVRVRVRVRVRVNVRATVRVRVRARARNKFSVRVTVRVRVRVRVRVSIHRFVVVRDGIENQRTDHHRHHETREYQS